VVLQLYPSESANSTGSRRSRPFPDGWKRLKSATFLTINPRPHIKPIVKLEPMFTRQRCLIIGEVAQAHDGSLGAAHAYIDAIIDAGADAVKFQTHYADYESSADEPFRVNFSRQDATRRDYWKRLEFTPEQWQGLADHCRERGILFLSSPFSRFAMDVLEQCGVPAWKVASGELPNLPLLDALCATSKPIILSSGMSGWGELDRAVERVKRSGNELCVMQCTTSYPCPPDRVGLNVMQEMRARYGTFVGLSDHSGTMWPAIAGTMLGMDVYEVHVAFHRKSFGPDALASLTPEELAKVVEGIRFTEIMRNSPVDKDTSADTYADLRRMFNQGLVAAGDLPQGSVLSPDNLTTRKPLRGIPASQYESVLGRRLRVALAAGTPIEEIHLI
jgi:N,N'-diacetyllegionaminate synthase